MKQTDFSLLKIKEYTYWTLFLHENQCYLGRMYLLANDPDKKDLMEITTVEREEFFKIGSDVKIALNHLFSPDKINYAALGNVFETLHVHFIPRYKTKRNFLGIDFTDARWGQNYAPYDYAFEISPLTISEIKTSIQNILEIKS